MHTNYTSMFIFKIAMLQKSIKESCTQPNACSSRGNLGKIGVWKREKQNKTGV